MATSSQTASAFSQKPNQIPPESIVFGRTEYMHTLRAQMERAAALDVPVLLKGESGTGKDIIARMLHQHSPWMSGVFVRVRCSCIPERFDDLLKPSADVLPRVVQAAHHRRQIACHGTLFLDEVSETTPALQTKLLKLLQEGQFCSISFKRFRLNLRLVCATNSALEDAAEQGRFRRDLLYRINVVTLRVPPLRERVVDIPEILNYLLDLFSCTYRCEPRRPSAQMLQSLLKYSWPGNIRELENFVKRYVLFGCQEAMCDELASNAHRPATPELLEPGAVSLKEITRKAVRELEREAILKVLQANKWNRKRAASVLNISYRSLLYKLKETGMGSASSVSSRMSGAVLRRAAM